MSTIALAIPDLSRALNHASPRHLFSSVKFTSRWKLSGGMNSSRKLGIELGLGKSNPINLELYLMRRLRAASEGASDYEELYEAREARLDEEYWAAAWLRAECHWEGRENERNAENFKWLYAEKEFVALKKRCGLQIGKKCKCILMVKKEDDDVKEKDTLVNCVVGTLDVHVQYFSPGQTFPEERVVAAPRAPIEAVKSYGYISNLCVAKSARRQGLATTMLQHAISAAKDLGIEKVFLLVYRHNEGALRLYEKVGFKVVEAANFDQFSSAQAQPLLMCYQL